MLSFICPKVLAQLSLSAITTSSEPVMFTQSEVSGSVQNLTLGVDGPYSVIAWASQDGAFSDNDIIYQEDFGLLSDGQSRDFSFTRSTPLAGDNRLIKDIVGSRYLYRVCLRNPGQAEVCSRLRETVHPADVSEVTASLGNGEPDIVVEFSVETRNGESPFDTIDVVSTTRALDLDGGGFPVLDPLPIADLQLIQGNESSQRYRFERPAVPGVPTRISIGQCVGITCSPGSGPNGPNAIGFSMAQAFASDGVFKDRIRVEWPKFASNLGYGAYLIKRYEVQDGQLKNLMEKRVNGNPIISAGALERYDDMSAQRGKKYQYDIFLCFGVSGLENCDPTIYPKIAESLIAKVDLVDSYEQDNSFATATEISRSVTQSRSMHVAEDQDWVKFTLRRPQSVDVTTCGPVNRRVKISIKDSSLKDLAYIDNPDTPCTKNAFAAVSTPVIPAGEYFIKVYQMLGSELIGDVPNYTLTIDLKTTPVMAPMILLLSDD